MKSVGLYKAIHQVPIEDIPREKIVIEKAMDAADKQGVTATSVKDFFRAQISVAKVIQYR